MFAIIQKWPKTLAISRHPGRHCSLWYLGVKDITVRNVRPAAKPQKLSASTAKTTQIPG
jgi:hypothetical protein